jgi:hypothetical protein
MDTFRQYGNIHKLHQVPVVRALVNGLDELKAAARGICEAGGEKVPSPLVSDEDAMSTQLRAYLSSDHVPRNVPFVIIYFACVQELQPDGEHWNIIGDSACVLPILPCARDHIPHLFRLTYTRQHQCACSSVHV